MILDTNFLLIPGQFQVDIFEEIDRILDRDYRLCTVKPVISELQKLSKSRGEEGKAAKIALTLMDRHTIETLETQNKIADASIVEAARETENPVIATNDKGLKKQFEERSIPLIYLRTKDHLEMKGDVR